ncbi:MAG: DNA adenine methylase [Chloroflexota bacterium]
MTMKKMPQPIPYQGSKRNLAHKILHVLPASIDRLVEPFAGSAAISVRAAYTQQAKRFHLNDLNQPLMTLMQKIINTPDEIADAYEQLWHQQLGNERAFYNEVRDKFNQTHEPDLFLYLLARCVKAAVRYNSNGQFNQGPDNRRRGRTPQKMRQDIYAFSELLQGRTDVSSVNYASIFESIDPISDVVYMDPPYQGTSTGRNPRYYSGIDFTGLVDFLTKLNRQDVMFALSYDGRKGTKTYGQKLPDSLELTHFEIDAGRSTQSTLLGGKEMTVESLYLSPALVAQVDQNLFTQAVSDKLEESFSQTDNNKIYVKLKLLIERIHEN